MRVLVVGSLPRVGAPNHLPWLRYTASALRRLGHEVATATYRESWGDSPALRSRAAAFPGGTQLLARYAASSAARRDRRLLATARRFRPQLTIVLKGEVFPDAALADVKRLTHGPLVTWWVDDPWIYPASVRQFPLFDRVFLWDRSYMPALAAAGVPQTAFLPCACDETIYHPQRLPDGEAARLKSDVAFVASYYPERAAIVRALGDAMTVGVWGIGWDAPGIREQLGAHTELRGGIVNDRAAARIYAAATIGLNLHHPQSRLGGVNTRTFELLASGTLPLVDQIPGIEELLEPGRDVVCYRSPGEAREAASRYLVDAPGRRAIVERGRARVLAEHTYVARMRTVTHEVAT